MYLRFLLSLCLCGTLNQLLHAEKCSVAVERDSALTSITPEFITSIVTLVTNLTPSFDHPKVIKLKVGEFCAYDGRDDVFQFEPSIPKDELIPIFMHEYMHQVLRRHWLSLRTPKIRNFFSFLENIATTSREYDNFAMSQKIQQIELRQKLEGLLSRKSDFDIKMSMMLALEEVAADLLPVLMFKNPRIIIDTQLKIKHDGQNDSKLKYRSFAADGPDVFSFNAAQVEWRKSFFGDVFESEFDPHSAFYPVRKFIGENYLGKAKPEKILMGYVSAAAILMEETFDKFESMGITAQRLYFQPKILLDANKRIMNLMASTLPQR